MSSGVWSRTLVYLGLKEEPEEGYDLPERDLVGSAEPTRPAGAAHARFDPVDDPDLAPGRGETDASNVRQLRVAAAAADVRLAVVEVAVFEDVEHVGSRYRGGQPVLFDVSGADTVVARRVIDFVAGLTFALRGRMHRIGTRAFLLVPDGVALPPREAERLHTLGYRVPDEVLT